GSQRALMLLAVNDREPNVPLLLCLSNILDSDPDLGFQSNDFSKFELNPTPPVSDCRGGDS
ncbi:MAG TPA: hypothetical protein VEL74_13890, partial [Thermoanaerobaculia bacterium]|nr:hypothetical protein [Thermoanaerobaculia bacterium]